MSTDTEAVLTAEKVEAVMKDCLFRDDEPMELRVEVEGIINRFGFHPERLAGHKDDIAALLDELPDEFKQSQGGGCSFLNACNDRHGTQWTGLHRTMDHLFSLGVATGRVTCQMPRESWPVLPGGMPYYVINDMPEQGGGGHDGND